MGDRWTRSSLGTSGYVWLPVEIGKDGKMSIRSATNWTLEDLKASAKLSFTALDAQIQIARAKMKRTTRQLRGQPSRPFSTKLSPAVMP